MRKEPEGKLSRKMVVAWRVSAVLYCILIELCILCCTLPIYFSSYYRPAAPLIISAVLFVLLIAFFVIFFPAYRYRFYRYEVTEDEIDIMKGAIFRRRTVTPLIRVQHVDTRRGPIMRACGLASVSFATAAGTQEIPGLLPEEADVLRDRVAELARIAREDL